MRFLNISALLLSTSLFTFSHPVFADPDTDDATPAAVAAEAGPAEEVEGESRIGVNPDMLREEGIDAIVGQFSGNLTDLAITSTASMFYNTSPLSDEDVMKIIDGLKGCPNLSRLRLSNNGLNTDQALSLLSELQYGLERLDLSENQITNFPTTIYFGMTLTKLQLSHNPLGDSGVEKVASAIQGSPLTRLRLMNVGMTSDGMAHLAGALPGTIKYLNVQNNSIGDAGVDHLRQRADQLKDLKILNIMSNGLTSDALDSIFEIVSSHPPFHELFMSGEGNTYEQAQLFNFFERFQWYSCGVLDMIGCCTSTRHRFNTQYISRTFDQWKEVRRQKWGVPYCDVHIYSPADDEAGAADD